MFTGIVTHTARLLERTSIGEDLRLRFKTEAEFLEGCREGDSIAVSGVCLTALDIEGDCFSADVSVETLRCTTIADWRTGRILNLERPMPADGRFDGHMVSGHVDGTADVVSLELQARSRNLIFEVSDELLPFIAGKGSVCLDGVSLTVNEVDDRCFSVSIIPHTQAVTSMDALQTGDSVNIEVDLVARYMQRLLLRSGVNEK